MNVRAGIRMCCWGRVDPTRGNAVDATIGVPSSSLAPLGLRDLPEDFVFAIPVRGSSQQPDFDFVRCARTSCLYCRRLTTFDQNMRP